MSGFTLVSLGDTKPNILFCLNADLDIQFQWLISSTNPISNLWNWWIVWFQEKKNFLLKSDQWPILKNKNLVIVNINTITLIVFEFQYLGNSYLIAIQNKNTVFYPHICLNFIINLSILFLYHHLIWYTIILLWCRRTFLCVSAWPIIKYEIGSVVKISNWNLRRVCWTSKYDLSSTTNWLFLTITAKNLITPKAAAKR